MAMLTLDLKEKTLKDMDDNFYFTFEKWSFTPRVKGEVYGYFNLDNLVINHRELFTVIYEVNKEVVSFKADYDGEGSCSDVEIISETSYNEESLVKELDLFLDTYIYKNPLTGGEGVVKGEIETYFDYDNEEFVIKINKLSLEEY